MHPATLTGLPPSRHGAAPGLVRAGWVLEEVGAHVASWGRVLVVTDAGVRAAGHADAVCASLTAAGIAWRLWDGAGADPRSSDVERAHAQAPAADGLVAVGGGAVLDAAKGLAIRRANAGPVERYAGHGVASGPLMPIAALPCTAGTGSEAQSFAIITRDVDGVKVAIGHPGLLPRVSLLDPRLVATCPRAVVVSAGLDAMVHAVEASISTATAPAARRVALEALAVLWAELPRLARGEASDVVRLRMLVAAHQAGACIEAGMLGAAHGTANALSARFGVPHGLAVARTLPAVLRWLGEAASAPAAALGFRDAAAFAAAWEALVDALGGRVTLGEPDVDALVALARPQWTLRFSPRPVDDAALRSLFLAVVAG